MLRSITKYHTCGSSLDRVTLCKVRRTFLRLMIHWNETTRRVWHSFMCVIISSMFPGSYSFHLPGRFVCANPKADWTQRGVACLEWVCSCLRSVFIYVIFIRCFNQTLSWTHAVFPICICSERRRKTTEIIVETTQANTTSA